MKNRKSITARSIQIVSILAALTFVPPALAECIESVDSQGYVTDTTILAIDANNGCSDIQGQVGCFISGKDLDGGTCTSEDDSFTVQSKLNEDGSLSWKRINGTGEIDTHMVAGGAGGKNNCGYVHKFQVDSGSGGDCKGDIIDEICVGAFQNITGLHVCTDGKDDIAPPPPEVAFPLPSCSATGYKLDATGIECPTYNLDEFNAAWTAYNEATDAGEEVEPPEFEEGDQKPVVVCNLEKDKEDWGTTDGSDVCCQCGIPEAQQTACVVTEDRDECAQSMTVNPTQSVELMFFKDDVDPCTWIKTSKGWKQWCY